MATAPPGNTYNIFMWVPLLLQTLGVSRAPSASSGGSGSGLLAHMRSGARTPVLVLDANNMRGACSFAISQSDLSGAISAWATEQRLPTLICLDHGTEPRVWRTGAYSALTLSGSRMTADDVIIRDAWWARSQAKRDVFVVTADAGLAQRARRLKAAGPVQVIGSFNMARLILGNVHELGEPNTKERTEERAAAAAELAVELDGGGAMMDADERGGSHEISEIEHLIAEYVRWAATEAVTGTRHMDPVVPSPSTKRRLRRKRHMRQYFDAAASQGQPAAEQPTCDS